MGPLPNVHRLVRGYQYPLTVATSKSRGGSWRSRSSLGSARNSARHGSSPFLIACAVGLAVAAAQPSVLSPDRGELLFLTVVSAISALASVRVDRGTINLTAIPAQAAAIILPPMGALIVGFVSGFAVAVNRRHPMSLIASVTWTTLPALCRTALFGVGDHGPVAQVTVITTFTLINWIVVTLALHDLTGEPALVIWKRNQTSSWFGIFVYLALGGVLVANVLDRSIRGYVLASIVILLAVALTDTLANRRDRALLHAALSDADRVVMAARAVEGVTHSLRNHLAAAHGHLDAIREGSLADTERKHVSVANASIGDAIQALNAFAAAAAPKVILTGPPVAVNHVIDRAVLASRPGAEQKNVKIAVVRHVDYDLRVRGNPLLLREAVSNLVQNAVQAAPPGSVVEVTAGMKRSGVFISVTDRGSGVAPEHRRRLFEPHFTTKVDGTGMGLFTSFGIVREHRGSLSFEPGRPGAIFTIVLPRPDQPRA